MIGVAVFWKINIQLDIASESTDGEIRFMYKAAKKTKAIRRYTEALELHNGTPKLHWEDITGCISVVETKIVTYRVKKIDIPICFLQ